MSKIDYSRLLGMTKAQRKHCMEMASIPEHLREEYTHKCKLALCGEISSEWIAKAWRRDQKALKAKLVSVLDAMAEKGWKPGSAAGWDQQAVERNYSIVSRAGFNGDSAEEEGHALREVR
jgi:hypothetical protein